MTSPRRVSARNSLCPNWAALAVDQRYQGQKLGSALLWDAALRAKRSEVSVVALVVNAKDATAEAFCRRHGCRSPPEVQPVPGAQSHPQAMFKARQTSRMFCALTLPT